MSCIAPDTPLPTTTGRGDAVAAGVYDGMDVGMTLIKTDLLDEMRAGADKAREIIRQFRIGMAPELDRLNPPGLRNLIDDYLRQTQR